jgi:hypothetical protein
MMHPEYREFLLLGVRGWPASADVRRRAYRPGDCGRIMPFILPLGRTNPRSTPGSVEGKSSASPICGGILIPVAWARVVTVNHTPYPLSCHIVRSTRRQKESRHGTTAKPCR